MGLIPNDEGGALIQEADDNVDHNTETIDGKETLHAMARVIFQRQTTLNVEGRKIKTAMWSQTSTT